MNADTAAIQLRQADCPRSECEAFDQKIAMDESVACEAASNGTGADVSRTEAPLSSEAGGSGRTSLGQGFGGHTLNGGDLATRQVERRAFDSRPASDSPSWKAKYETNVPCAEKGCTSTAMYWNSFCQNHAALSNQQIGDEVSRTGR